MKTNGEDVLAQNKAFLWAALGTGLLLMVPFAGMQFSQEVNWTLSDFVMMGVLIFSVSSLFIIAARRVKKENRPIVGLICLFAFMWLWAELAVGIFTNWGS